MELRHLMVPDSFRCLAVGRLKLVPLSPEPRPLIIGGILPGDEIGAAGRSFPDCTRGAASTK